VTDPDQNDRTVRVPAATVGLSTASVYPEPTAAAFEIAAELGYDGVEVMVWTEPASQDAEAIAALSDRYGLPVLAVHAPCLLITQRVWSPDPWERLRRSVAMAERVGASTVVLHPPFRWQRDYVREFVAGVRRFGHETAVRLAVENMFPLRARGRVFSPYAPTWDPTHLNVPHFTLDTSHTAVSRTDAVELAGRMGAGLTHVHLADGTGLSRDEHLIPGRGDQKCGPLLERLAAQSFDGAVIVEVSTRGVPNRAAREADLAEALAFARLHLAAPATTLDTA
jgi:sugar phosphate isomerase/epimerase